MFRGLRVDYTTECIYLQLNAVNSLNNKGLLNLSFSWLDRTWNYLVKYERFELKLKYGKIIVFLSNKNEIVIINFEQKFKEFSEFYKKNKIYTPVGFNKSIRGIWENNVDKIQKAIQTKGFDEILIIPRIKNLSNLHEKMTNGYNPTFCGDNFKSGGSFAKALSQTVNKSHITLVHKIQNLKDDPEIKLTFNIQGKDIKLDQVLTLEEYLIFQRKYFEETQKHIDENTWTWLSTKLGTRLVGAGWHSSRNELRVNAGSFETQREDLGARPSCSFF